MINFAHRIAYLPLLAKRVFTALLPCGRLVATSAVIAIAGSASAQQSVYENLDDQPARQQAPRTSAPESLPARRSPLRTQAAEAAGAEDQAGQAAPNERLPANALRRPVRVAQKEPRAADDPAEASQRMAPVRIERRQPEGSAEPAGRPRAPFTLTPAQESRIEAILTSWEAKQKKVDTFKCSFAIFEYAVPFSEDLTNNDVAITGEGKGVIKFKRPDRGKFQVVSKRTFTPPAKSKGETEGKWADEPTNSLEHWICDGKSIFSFDHDKKELNENELPEELRGKAIANGPLPFIFSADAAVMKQRYYMREITPKESAGVEVWLEAYPRMLVDAQEYEHADVILDAKTFQPIGLQLYSPFLTDKKLPSYQRPRTAYRFENVVVNDPLSLLKLDFVAPMTPLGWKRVVHHVQPREPKSETAERPSASQQQARTPVAPVRK